MDIRIEKGEVTDEELAAVIAVLLLRAWPAAAESAVGQGRRRRARWGRPEHRVGRCSPRSWQVAASD
ncbi:hypothetical protein amrb99_13710 [Actinomadura sp. RB99]|uniref:acyl-CoA carboxylase subunit epsilon n=1 Tax=Actinomadura sp. RB99 TaxID=2691577 RepID=UPI001689E443|nr:acyl-CoA carboxylase subunit epsilon [Actinomadura sp. RB99]MBD2892461.1 hypothetical protein [Actinomadura sp. RB99]